MAIKGAEYAVTRVVATLQAFLAAELTLIQTEMADGVMLPDVPASSYFQDERQISLVPTDSAITVNVDGTDPLAISSTLNSPGVYHAEHSVVVGYHQKDTGNEEPDAMKRRVLRYARAIERVLCIKYPTLPSGGAETVFFVRREGTATYIEAEQGEGQYVRSARLPLRVQTYEYL